MNKDYYWLAVNGASVSGLFTVPLKEDSFDAVPTPELLLGFATREEALSVQKFLLTGPVKEVRKFIQFTLPARARNGEIVLKKMENPQPPTKVETKWITKEKPKSTKLLQTIKNDEELLDWMGLSQIDLIIIAAQDLPEDTIVKLFQYWLASQKLRFEFDNTPSIVRLESVFRQYRTAKRNYVKRGLCDAWLEKLDRCYVQAAKELGEGEVVI